MTGEAKRVEQVDLLVFGAHPDDAEIGMAGTIVKHAAAGLRVAVCDLTEAEMSSNGTVETRREEARQASAAMGLTARINLGLPDRGLRFCDEHIAEIVRVLRRFRPKIVFAPYWEDRHPDHNMCSRLVEEAVFNAKLRKYLPELEPMLVEQLLFYFINDWREPDLVVDVAEGYEQKREALRAYATQFQAVAGQNGFVATPLNQGYLERVEARDSLLGQKRSMTLAEGFIVKTPYAVHLFASPHEYT